MASCRSIALLLTVVAAISATGVAGYTKSFNFTNRCSYKVWPGMSTSAGGAGAAALDTTGFELAPGAWRAMSVPSAWSGRVWGRTICSTDSSSGRFSCVTGDCNSGRQDCEGGAAAPPVTLAQFTLGIDDVYAVSMVDGFNLPIMIAPQGAAAAAAPGVKCTPAGCAENLNGECPAELSVVASAVTGTTGAVACQSACQTFGLPQYCCTGPYGSPDTCNPTKYSEFFKTACPLTATYAFDGAGSTFMCGGENTGGAYDITFCPTTMTVSGQASTTSSSSSHPPGETTTNQPATTTGGGSSGSQVEPWSIVLAVAILGLVAAALGALEKAFGFFSRLCCCK